MGRYCVDCGTEIKEGYKFCLNCGTKTEYEGQANNQTTQGNVGYSTQQINTPKKSNKKLIITISAIAAILMVIIVVLLVVLGGNSVGRFVGSWVVLSGGNSTFSGSLIFESNGDLKAGNQGAEMTIGKWSIEENKICLEFAIIETEIPKICCSYSFSNGGNTLTIFVPTGEGNNIVLTR
ncbi:MAG: hypothetical protein A3K77_00220 [Euryarchaeota archaeon RBG_13_31_8]|nr:MAG: hypothetical protein A3K77_00220 [Euryarchaeota archaeon RBG_13_31_8]